MQSCLSLVRRLALRLIISIGFLILGFVTTSSTQLVGEKESSILPWGKNYTLIVLNTSSVSELRQAEEFIRSKGGKLGVDVPPRVITGWIATEVAPQLVGQYGIIEVSQEPVDELRFRGLTEEERFLINYFNRVSSGRREKEILEAAPGTKGILLPDVLEKGEVSLGDVIQNLKSKGLDLTLLGIPPGQEAKLLGTSDRMVGTVAVRVFWVESNGAIDPNLYSWNSAAVDTIKSEILDGLNWWVSEAASREITLSFTLVANTMPDSTEMQPYEPITHPLMADSLWIKAIMANLGFSTGGKIARTRAYNNFLRFTYSTNWSYCAFVAYNPPPAPDRFPDGYFGLAYILGPYTQLLYRNDGLAVSQFDLVFSHETGHIFGACDEYNLAGFGCTSCDSSCNYLRPWALNGNCEYCNDSSVSCMMKARSLQLCPWTPAQLGWVFPVCQVNPTSLDFGTVTKGRYLDRTFSITNTREGTLTGSVSETCDHYSIISGGGSYSLGAGESTTVTVRFAPTSTGTKTCTVETGDSICSDVSCTGIGDPVTSCSVSPTCLDFGTVTEGQSKDLSFTITNTGEVTLSDTVSEACVDYSLVGDTTYSLTTGQSKIFTVRFAPTSAGFKTCTIETGNSACIDVRCSGSDQTYHIRGDVNNDSKITVSDVIYLINYLFKGGPPPDGDLMVGDVNCDGNVNVSDVIYLINYLFRGGPC